MAIHTHIRRKYHGGHGTGGAAASYSNDFNGGAEAPVSHGGAWTSGAGSFIDLDQKAGGYCEGTGSHSMAYVSTPTFSDDHSATVTMKPAYITGPAVRCSSSGAYYLWISNSTTMKIRHEDGTASSPTTLGADYTVAALIAGDTVTLKVVGSTFTVYVNGVQQGSTRSDSTYTTGSPGMMAWGFGQIDGFSASDE